MNIVVLHGPNLNLLGERPSDDSALTLDALNQKLRQKAKVLEMSVRIFQSNHEGALIDHLHNERKWADAFVINPGALTHYSYALRDAIAAVGAPCIEVHLSDLNKREPFRKNTVLGDVVQERIFGKGLESYIEALEVLDVGAQRPKPRAGEPLRAAPKSIGRAKIVELPEPPKGRAKVAEEPKKTLGRKVETAKTAAPPAKSLGRASGRSKNLVSRELVREKIAERLSGKVTASALATWARSHWAEVQGGAATEAGQREVLEDTLQQLMLATQPAARLSDDQLVELMTQLD
jgi:3-dehydroquinate dehydratase-2